MTYGDFLTICGEKTRKYLDVFLQDIKDKPSEDALMDDIRDDFWPLQDIEFPITQFAEETTTFHSSLFPERYLARHISTEYGGEIGLYQTNYANEILRHSVVNRFYLEIINAPFALSIYDY